MYLLYTLTSGKCLWPIKMEQFQNFLSMMSRTINMCVLLPITTWITISWMPYAFIKRWAWEYSQFLLSLRFLSRLQPHGSQQQQAVGSCSFNNKLWLVAPGCKSSSQCRAGPWRLWENTRIPFNSWPLEENASKPKQTLCCGRYYPQLKLGIGSSHLLRPIHSQQTISSLTAESGRRARRQKKIKIKKSLLRF